MLIILLIHVCLCFVFGTFRGFCEFQSGFWCTMAECGVPELAAPNHFDARIGKYVPASYGDELVGPEGFGQVNGCIERHDAQSVYVVGIGRARSYVSRAALGLGLRGAVVTLY